MEQQVVEAAAAPQPFFNRKARRRAQALRRALKKRVPFGRVAVTDFVHAAPDAARNDGEDRVEYIHMTKGRMSRRVTMPLLNDLISVG